LRGRATAVPSRGRGGRKEKGKKIAVPDSGEGSTRATANRGIGRGRGRGGRKGKKSRTEDEQVEEHTRGNEGEEEGTRGHRTGPGSAYYLFLEMMSKELSSQI
jgi:hypothetical protein